MPLQSPQAVIVGLDSLQGLQLSRILAARHIPILGVAKDLRYHSCRTRTCRRIVESDTSSDMLVDTLVSIARNLDTKAVLYPCQDTNVMVLSRHREALQPYFHMVLPDEEIVELLIDKAKFHELALRLGVEVPRTRILRSVDDVEKVIAEDSFPLLLKPPNRDFGWNKLTKEKAVWVRSGQQLRNLYEHFAPVAETLLAQDWIEGQDSDLYTCNVYFSAKGKPVASFVSRKLRQYPPQLGQGTLAESVTEPEVAATTRRFYEQIGLRGFGYLEFKRERSTGRLVAIEPNVGRPTGRSALAEASGVELHASMYWDVLDLPHPPGPTEQTDGVKWLHLLRDIQSSACQWRNGDLSIGGWLGSIRGDKMHAILSARDPMPFISSLGRTISVAVSERARRVPKPLRRGIDG